jgi:hypothetical protein
VALAALAPTVDARGRLGTKRAGKNRVATAEPSSAARNGEGSRPHTRRESNV